MAQQLQTIAVDNPLLLYSVKKENFIPCYFQGRQHVRGTLVQQMGREHFSPNCTMWLQETLFPTLHTSSSRHAALLPYLPEDEFTKKLQSYTPEERSLFSVMPVATYRPKISHRDAQLMRSSRDFILPSTHWMALPADFCGITQTGMLVLPPTLHGPFFQHGLEMVNFNFCPRAAINFALFGFLLSGGMQLPTFNSRLVLYQIQLQSDHLNAELLRREGGRNRTYIDYFLKVREGFGFIAAELTTSQAYVVGRDTCWNLSRHLFEKVPHCQRHFNAPFFRWQHLLLPASSWDNFNQLSGYDEYVAPALVEQHLRPRL